jgi:hypothetical protein
MTNRGKVTNTAAPLDSSACYNVHGFAEFGGLHCETSAVQKVLHHAGIVHNEAFLFGMAGGVGFVFWRKARDPVPFVGGRNGRFPQFVQRLGESIGQHIDVLKTTSARRAYQLLTMELRHGRPAVCYGDIKYLPYFNTARHFGGHAFVVYRIDERDRQVWISDRGNQPYRITLRDLSQARASGTPVFRPRNAILRVQFHRGRPIRATAVRRAILRSCEAMLRPPIKNFGIPGLGRFASYLEQAFAILPAQQLCRLAVSCYLNLELAGTGGCAFRKMYRRFLLDATSYLPPNALQEAIPWLERSIHSWKALIRNLLPPVGPATIALRQNLQKKEAAFMRGGEAGAMGSARCQAAILRMGREAGQELAANRGQLILCAAHARNIQRAESKCFALLERRLR